MKNVLLAGMIFLPIVLFAQVKHDYVWLFGYHPEPGFPDPVLGGSQLNFNNMPPDTSSFVIPIRFTAIAMISNSEGSLQFYTNGCQIANNAHQIMDNGGDINPGVYHDAFCEYGYPLSQGVLALPFPDSNGHYILLHYRKEDTDTGQIKNLLYTIVNMNTPDGLGKVEAKNQMILTDFMADMLTAVRHANGRDWWIVAPKTDSEEGYLFLLTPNGVEGPLVRDFGQYWNINGANGQAVFSPDGTKYARMNRINHLHLANFNRCTGIFSKGIKITFPNDTITSSGAAFSPNSRYLYVSASRKVYQFDTWATNVSATQQTVAIYDGFQSPFSTRFFQPMLAPDGKIYMTTTNSNNVLHVIHSPDEGGAACNFEQHGLTLPTLHAFMAPNFPHFRLYDLPGSPCDTLGINGPVVSVPEVLVEKEGLRLWPNPTSGEVLIAADQILAGQWSLVSVNGIVAKIGNWPSTATTLRLDVSDLAPGMYYFQLIPETGKAIASKLVITR